MGKFVHLHAHSHYSLLDGLAKIDALIAKAKACGMDALALTDHGVMYGAVEFYKKAKAAGVKPILGLEAYVTPKSRLTREPGEKYHHLILLAENQTGWKNLVRLCTIAHLEGFYYKPRVDKELLAAHHEGLIALSACLGGEVASHLLSGNYEAAKRTAQEYRALFGEGNYFLEIQKHPHIPESEKVEPLLIKLSAETGIPLVATQDSHYIDREDGEYHDILLAVQTGNKLSDDDRLTLKADDFSFSSPEEMAEKFSFCPDAASRTAEIAARCHVELELGKALLPNFPKPEGKTANEYLKELINERIGNRFAKEARTPEVLDRVRYEVGVIEKTGFADYFLIVQDLINWAKGHGIAVGPGRGSAAGSIVSYILGITDLNPLRYGLLFERFLNPERIQMPDIDIDFADRRRDEVLEYARQKYGTDRVAQIITFGTMAARAAVRDAGRAMGLAYGFCDSLAKLIPPTMDLKESLEKVPELLELYRSSADAKRLLDAAAHLEGVARHASVHACGTVIAKDPLIERVPLQLAPQDKNNIITQFEMHAIEDLGLLKIDLLGLRNLTIIENTVRLVKDTEGADIKIADLPLNDQKTFELLRRADTVGVFQFESDGMRRYMKEIQPTELEDLIALVALYRPGPMELIPSFLARKSGREKITYLHPLLEPILKNTYGIGVYQEQMMQIARDLALFTLAEADTLRKAIGKKIKSLLDEQQEKLLSGMLKNGIDAATARSIWELFPPFARYGFNKSHAACYALIGYETAYLKAHYPVEFMASLLNAESSDIDRIAFLVAEAKQARIPILPPDVNASFVDFTPEEPAIRFGLLGIKNVGGEIAKGIVEERSQRGPFHDFSDFLNRINHKDLNKKSLESLAKGGVFDSLGVERGVVLENIDEIVRYHAAVRHDTSAGKNSLFGSTPLASSLKLKSAPPVPQATRLAWEKELLGFFLSAHPLDMYKNKIAAIRPYPIKQIRLIKSEVQPLKLVGLVSQVKKIITKTGQPMVFATIEDLSGEAIEAVVFNSIFAKSPAAWEPNTVVYAEGRVSLRDNEPKFLCDRAQKMEV